MRTSLRRSVFAFAAVALVACGSQHTLPYASTASYDAVPHDNGPGRYATWTELGPVEIKPGMDYFWNPGKTGNSGKLNAVVVDPSNKNVIYVAGGVGRDCESLTQAGIFKSVDGGATWQHANYGLTDTYVNDLWIDPTNGGNLVAATEKGGIFRSSNGGELWQSVVPNVTARMLVSSKSGLYAGTSTGVLVSRDQGATWQQQLFANSIVNAIGYSDGRYYAGTTNGNVYRKTGEYGSWSLSGHVSITCGNTSGIREIAVDPNNKDDVYLAVNNDVDPRHDKPYENSLYNSKDGGVTWNNVPVPNVLDGPAQTVTFLPSGLLLVGIDSEAATFDGNKWKQILNPNANLENNIFGDMRREYVQSNGSVIVASDQGAWIAPNYTGRGVRSLSAGIANNELTDLAVRGSEIGVTMHDALPMVSQDGGKTWYYAKNGDVGFEDGSIAFGNAPRTSNVCLVANGSYYTYSNDRCKTNRGPYPTSAYGWNQGAITFDPKNPNLVYVVPANGVVQRSTNAGRTLVNLPWKVTLKQLVINPKDDQNIVGISLSAQYYYIYGNDSNTIYYTHNGGQTWSRSKISCSNIGMVAINPVDPTHVTAACGGAGGVRMFRSTNGAKSFTYTSTPIVPDLRARRNDYAQLYRSLSDPRIPLKDNAARTFYPMIFDLQYNPTPPAGRVPALVVATTLGGAVSFDDGVTWSSINGNAVATEFWKAAWSNGTLYVASRGEGVLSTPLQTP